MPTPTDAPQQFTPSNRARVIRLTLVSTAASLLLTGCSSLEKPEAPPTTAIIRTSAPPPYSSVATRYNARVAKLDRVRSTAGLIVKRPDGDGTTTDQVEGNLQFQRPLNLNLRIDKVGQTVFVLGSNDTRYWWFDLSGEHRAKVGTHEKASSVTVEKFGVPVQPADLAELMGILPLDASADAKTNWSSDGRHVVAQLATPRGARWMWLDPTTLEPVRIDLINRFGERSVTAELSKYVVVPVTGDAMAKPRMASLFYIDLPAQRISIKLTLSEPTNPANSMKPKAFDLLALLDAYGIEEVEDLDGFARPAQPESTPKPISQPTQAEPKPQTPPPAAASTVKPTPPSTSKPGPQPPTIVPIVAPRPETPR